MSERTALVVSPHFDDAVLSCWSVLEEARGARVVNVFAGLPDPGVLGEWDQRTAATDSRARVRERIDEDRRALAPVAPEPVNLEFLDAQYRAAPPPLGEIAEALRPRLHDGDVVYAPAAIGAHPDHVLVRDAVLSVRPDARLYADQPYTLVYGWELPRATKNGRLARRVVLAPAARLRKLTAVRQYRTQLRGLSEGLGFGADAHGVALELFWRSK